MIQSRRNKAVAKHLLRKLIRKRPCHVGGGLPSLTYSRTIRDDQNQL